MSFFKTASLVLVSDFAASSASAVGGTNTGKVYSIKPTDGSGDFTFERGSDITATRVNSSGLIEKGRENLLLQSNQFDTTWSLNSVSVTSGQSGYDGSTDAWLLETNSSSGRLEQSVSLSGVHTLSFYAKKGTVDYAAFFGIESGGLHPRAWFNLSNGTIPNSNHIIDASMLDIGGGWYRCSVTFDKPVNTVRIYPTNISNNFAVGAGENIYIQDAQLEQGLVATDYIETTTAPLRAGLLEDEPRFDYHNSASATPNTCPSLLLEPERTNLIEYSEYLGEELTGNRMAINDVVDTSPEGVVNASKLVPDTTPTSTHQSNTGGYGSFVSGDKITISMFAKADGFDGIILRFLDGSGAFTSNRIAYFDLNRGRWKNQSMDGTTGVMTGEVGMEDYGNGWYRCFATATADASGDVNIRIPVADVTAQDTYDETFTGDNTSGVLIYGLQLEAGYYPTSYIPTYGTAATRGMDNCSNAIANTSGYYWTLFIDYANFHPGDVSGDNSIVFKDSSDVTIFALWGLNGGFTIRSFSGDTNGNYYTGNQFGKTAKAIIRYDGSEIGLFIDGVKQTLTFSASETNFNQLYKVNLLRSSENKYNFNQMLIFPEALSDIDCEILTGTSYPSFAAMAAALNYTVYE